MSRKLVPAATRDNLQLKQLVNKIWEEEFMNGYCGEYTQFYLPGDGWGIYLCYQSLFNAGKKGKEPDCPFYWVMMHRVEEEYNKLYQ